MEKNTILVFKDLTRRNPKEKRYMDKDLIEDDLKSLSKGNLVSHIKFGDGVIIKINEGIIDVNFDGIVKKFPFPDAFHGGFLRI